MQVWPPAVTLTGTFAALVPLSPDHLEDLQEASNDGELHKLWYTTVPSAEGMQADIVRRIAQPDMQAFAVIEQGSGKAVGMTTFMNTSKANHRVEIGSTWYRAAVQGTPVNTECKLMLLTHAFEELNCVCVEFRTHFMNSQSRRAIERLGAKLDGILRSNMIMKNGTVRDTAVYSIIASEWPSVKANLSGKLERLANR